MDLSTSQVQRQLYLLSLLSDNHRAYSVSELQNRLEQIGIEVSRKTVERDIDVLSSEFFICEEERDRETVFFADKYHLKNVQYSVSELLSLYFIQEMLKSYQGMDISDHALMLINRLISSAPAINRRYLEKLNEQIRISLHNVSPESNLDPALEALIRQALENRQSLRLEYHSFNRNETTHRDFDPYVLEINEGRWHLVGYCHLRNAIRDLRVSRIQKAVLLDKIFTRPADFFETYQAQRFQHLAGDKFVHLTIRFTGHAARLVEEYHSEDAGETLRMPDETLLYKRRSPLTPEILTWILGFGAEAEVIEPEFLRQSVKEQAEKMIRLYSSES